MSGYQLILGLLKVFLFLFSTINKPSFWDDFLLFPGVLSKSSLFVVFVWVI